jgi:SAM-dependent methyltransferase
MRWRLYGELASWWPLVSPREDYAGEAAFYERVLVESCARRPRTLLELGSGGGNNASYLKRRFSMTLVDLSPAMLAVSRRLNPGCEHVEGDMLEVRLGRRFDCVFIHDAVCYLTSEADLRRAMETAHVHCSPGGAVLIAPDFVRERFQPSTGHGGLDSRGELAGRALRYLEWTWDPDPGDDTYVVDYAILLRERDGSVRLVHDRHVEGLFSRMRWLRLLAEAGFEEARAVTIDHPELEPSTHEVLVARMPGGPAA